MCCISDWSRNCSFTDEGLTLPVEGGRIICIGEVVVCNCCGVLIVEDALLSNAARVVCEKSLIASIIGLDAASDIFPKISTCSFNASFSSVLCSFTAYSAAFAATSSSYIEEDWWWWWWRYLLFSDTLDARILLLILFSTPLNALPISESNWDWSTAPRDSLVVSWYRGEIAVVSCEDLTDMLLSDWFARGVQQL